MQLKHDEKILYKGKPFNSIQIIILNIVMSLMCFMMFSLTSKYLAMLSFVLLLCVIRYFDSLIITNKRIILRTFLITKSIKIDQLNATLELTIDPFIFQRDEWQRKLLGQDFQKFWRHRSNIYFPQNENRQTLSQLKFSLFSKKQTDKILAILSETWALDSNIKQPN
ncbi:MAG: hypothetical protein RR677_09590 [Acinetobacter sp.]